MNGLYDDQIFYFLNEKYGVQFFNKLLYDSSDKQFTLQYMLNMLDYIPEGKAQIISLEWLNTNNSHYAIVTKLDNKLYYVDKLHIFLGDVHFYDEYIDMFYHVQLNRIPYDFPQINIKNTYSNIQDYEWSDIDIINYQCHSSIKANMIA